MRLKASIMALIISAFIFVNVALYKPSDHEAVSESPTESSQMIPPADDIAPLAPPPKSIQPVQTVKTVSTLQPAKKAVSTQVAKTQKQRTFTVSSTFYTATCRGCSGFTASGYDVRKTVYYGKYRIIALDKSIPLGTIVNVKLANGNTFDAIVLDRGGKIGKGKADILVASYDEAIRLGRQRAAVTILKLGGR